MGKASIYLILESIVDNLLEDPDKCFKLFGRIGYITILFYRCFSDKLRLRKRERVPFQLQQLSRELDDGSNTDIIII